MCDLTNMVEGSTSWGKVQPKIGTTFTGVWVKNLDKSLGKNLDMEIEKTLTGEAIRIPRRKSTNARSHEPIFIISA